MIGGGVEPMMWKQFKEHFYEKYFSTNLRHLNEKEFLGLEQGSMSVRGLDQEFKQLSRFVPSMVATGAERTKRFI